MLKYHFWYFNRKQLYVSLPHINIGYEHLVELGGRRKLNKEFENTEWRHPAFRSYGDYLETEEFTEGLKNIPILRGLKL
ncbi:DUF488 family protein [Segetibacter aerophilus]|uniref:DUF488 family protein n=1 Tax=Segetibacter aerophilus TaxID=670293 RepID=UPI001478AEF5|nr:DUF488 family protein [Segetibacter aerophilus]